MSADNRPTRLLPILFAILWAQAASADVQFQLVKTGTTGATDTIRFTGVGVNKLGVTVPTPGPIINGNNLYAPDLLRVNNSWYTYHGGWLNDGQRNDKVYLGVSSTLNPAGSYSPASQLVVNNGAYNHVNDPSVVRLSANNWWMVYTAAPSPNGSGDWIHYSTSSDGINWTPNAGNSSTQIALNTNGFSVPYMARPSLVKTPAGWSMWFDADNGHSYLAQTTGANPTNFTVVKQYADVESFPGFMEPDVVRRPDGTYVAVVQRGFHDLYYATSPDGVDFTVSPTPALSVSNPMVGRTYIDNPGLIYDSTTDQVLGISYGMTDNPGLTQHDVGFSFNQYKIQVQSPDCMWHIYSNAESPDQQDLHVFQYRQFSRIQVLDPITGAIVLDQDFSSAAVGDQWQLVSLPEPSSLLLLLIGGLGLIAYLWRRRKLASQSL